MFCVKNVNTTIRNNSVRFRCAISWNISLRIAKVCNLWMFYIITEIPELTLAIIMLHQSFEFCLGYMYCIFWSFVLFAAWHSHELCRKWGLVQLISFQVSSTDIINVAGFLGLQVLNSFHVCRWKKKAPNLWRIEWIVRNISWSARREKSRRSTCRAPAWDSIWRK